MAERTNSEGRTQSHVNLAGAISLGTILGPLVAALFVLPWSAWPAAASPSR